MNIEESIEQIETLIDAWELDEAELNQTDINAMQVLLKENQELKKQHEECKDKINWYENFEVNKTIDKLRLKHNIQQKEFIKYMEDYINEMKTATVYDSVFTDAEVTEIVSNVLCLVLKEYKEIIEDDK